MSVLLADNMPGLEDASARLAELEASNPVETPAPSKDQAQRDEAADLAAAAAKGTTQNPTDKTTDTPAAPEAPANADTNKNNLEAGKPGDKAAADKAASEAAKAEAAKSNYAKSQERLEKTWDNVNKRKTELETRDQQLTQREQQLKQREEQIRQQAEQSQAQYKPEDYERSAGTKLDRAKGLHQQADGLEAKVKQLEDDGKYTEAAKLTAEAKDLRKRAYKEEGNAEDLKSHAEQLRRNPPPSMAQRDAEAVRQRKEWTLKAAQEFPEMAKENSDLQKRVAQTLNALWNEDRNLGSNPRIIYYVTKLEAAQTAAARVPALEKQLGELKAKVQEYEKLTAPGGESAVQKLAAADTAKTDEEEHRDLRETAAAMGNIR